MPASDPPPGAHITYTQQFRRCGKADCPACNPGKPGHGPYWYAYWRQDGRVRTRYLGRHLSPGMTALPRESQPTARSPDALALRVRTLGAFQVWQGNMPIPPEAWTRRRAGSLFKCLLGSTGYRLHREQASELLWPHATPATGAGNLRAAVHQVRKILDHPPAPSHLHPEGDWLVLVPAPLGMQATDWLDADAFANAATAALEGRDPAACRAALARYSGDYLPDDLYDEWAVGRREELQRERLALLLHLANLCNAQGMAREATRCLQEVLQADPCHEEAARALMRLQATDGRRTEAIVVYRSLARALKRELNLQPEPETLALFNTLRQPVAPAQDGRAIGPPAAAQQPPSNLPAPLTSFVGREEATAEIVALLAGGGPGRRLLTLIGAGGCGKTRLALEVARRLLPAYPDGVWLVDLAATAPDPSPDHAPVVRVAATTLGLHEQAQRSLQVVLTDHLRPRRLLLVLDNCEHVVAACAELAAALLTNCGDLQIIATSRQALDVPGEIWWRVPSLACPALPRPRADESAPSLVETEPRDLLRYEAVRLFTERAGARRPNVIPTVQETRTIAQICSRLDGIPLAIELAAACLPALPIDEIAARLEDRFHLLTGGSRVVLPRQQTLRATLDWSYALLDEPERAVLRRLSVFAGGWTLEAAMAVCAGDPIGAEAVPDLLAHLEAKSLIRDEGAQHMPDGQRRFGMLETVRQYGRELLEATRASGSPEATATQERHWDWCMALADQAVVAFVDAQQGTWLDRLELEHDNLRTALAWSRTEAGAVREGLRLAAALWRFWYVRGHFHEGRHWLETLLAQDAAARAVQAGEPHTALAGGGGQAADTPGTQRDSARARALTGAGSLAFIQGDLARARALQEECLALYRSYGNTLGIAAALHNLANVLYRLGDLGQSVALHEEALVLQRQLGRRDILAAFLNSLGNALFHQGNYERAEPLFEESLALCRELDHRWATAMPLRNLGLVAQAQGQYDRAAELFEESLALSRHIGGAQDTAVALNDLGNVATSWGDYRRAAALHEESLALAQKLGDQWSVANVLHSLANLALRQGEYRQAAARYRESLALAHEQGSKEGISANLEGLAQVYALEEQREHAQDARAYAVRLFGAAAALRTSIGAPLTPAARPAYEQAMAAARAALGETTFAALQAEGAAMPLEAAIAQAACEPA